MSRIIETHSAEAGSFACSHCGRIVQPAESGTEHRNHCPSCLWSLHVDLRSGDRRAGCRGDMEPIGIWIKGDGEWAVIHRCTRCGMLRANRIAGDDDEVRLFSLAARPITGLPFPARAVFERIERNA
ncbi:MAG: RNHCP domain-containing protein [Spirochaetes bacterium]|nr:RNHCP domain-containing protein [Spirochaetota bacterium]